jgi:cytochrome c oxidase subunit 2
VDIHRYEKLWLGASLLLIVIFIATVTYGAVGAGIEMVSASGGTISPDAVSEHPQFSDPGVERVGEDEYEAYVVARRFFFQPSTMQVPANSTVTFYVTSPDVIHGYSLVGTNTNVMAIPGQISEFTVEFDEPTTYGVVCNEYCGSAHHTMSGTLEVVPQSEWEGGN